jgi:hypothetical protein
MFMSRIVPKAARASSRAFGSAAEAASTGISFRLTDDQKALQVRE